ncbi:MAG: DNA polymerase III subunit delta', partial [Rhodospirillales bacterium]|nr:DNA polymerase III subunit delta' [Rhodospirillales bacterium]
HADLLTVEREWDPKRRRRRGEIVVDDVRRIAEFLRLTPAEGGWRVVVIDGAEDLNRNAANALLKVLEEPPPRAVLLLVCAAPGRLLPTIRSRCRRLGLAPLDAPAMDEALAALLPETPPADRARLAALVEGSPGRALQLAASDGVAYAELVAEVMGAPDGVGVLRAHALADTLGRQEDGFAIFLDLLRGALAASVRAAARGRPPAPLIARRPLDAWVDIWHALGALLDETENLYLDKRHALVAGLGLLASPPSRPMRET